MGGERPSRKTNAALRTRFPVSRKNWLPRTAVAKVLRSSFLCLEVITPTGADGFLRPERCGRLTRYWTPIPSATATGYRHPRTRKGSARLRFCGALHKIGGVEFAILPNWSVKAEYLYSNFNNQTIGPGTFTLIENVVRGGVNYRF